MRDAQSGTGRCKTGIRVSDLWLRKILRALYERRDLTRGEIIEATDLNPASVSRTLTYLFSRGILLKAQRFANGRRREVLNLNSEVGYFVAVDLEGDRIRFALTNFVGDARCRWEEPLGFRQPLTQRSLTEGINKVVRDLDASQVRRVLAVGVSYPGLLTPEGGLVAVNLGWSNYPLVHTLQDAFSWPLFLERDKDSCILTEHWLGSAKQHPNAIFLIAEGGIGLGILVEGRPLPGARDFAGEIGHWKLYPDASDRCNCGGTGCLESIASSPNIVRQYLDLSGVPPSERGGVRVTDIFEKARGGDHAARAVLDRVGRALGLALSHAIALLNPEIVILGGDIIAGDDLLLPIIRDEIERSTLNLSLQGIKIAVSGLGLDIRIRGAASLAFRSVLDDPALLRKICDLNLSEQSGLQASSLPEPAAAMPDQSGFKAEKRSANTVLSTHRREAGQRSTLALDN